LNKKVADNTIAWCIEIRSRVTQVGFLIEVSTSFSYIEKHAKISSNIFRQHHFHVDPFFKTFADTSRNGHKKIVRARLIFQLRFKVNLKL